MAASPEFEQWFNGLTPEEQAQYRESQKRQEDAAGFGSQQADHVNPDEGDQAHITRDVHEQAGATGGTVGPQATGVSYVTRQTPGISATPYEIYKPQTIQDTTTAGWQQQVGGQIAGLQSQQPQTMQAAQLGPAAQMSAAQIATAPQNQFRQQQMNLAQMLGSAAAGQGPSAAQAQLKLATDRNMGQALALALGARGGNQAGALKQAQMQRALIGQEAASQSSALRAQEQQAAQASLGQLLSAGRGADIGLASDQAGLQQQAGMANQAATNQFALQQGQFGQQANAMNLQAGAEQQKQVNDLTAKYMAMGMTLDEAQRNAEIQQRQFQASLLAQQEAARNQVGIQSATQGLQLVGAGASALGSMFAGGASGFSDERVKTDIEPGERALGELLSGIGAHEYSYKEPDKPLRGRGRFVSAMAQELEQTEIGKSMVHDTPEGKVVDYGKGLGAMLAGLSWVHKRLEQLEDGAPLGARLAGAV